SVPFEKASAVPDAADRAAAYGIPGEVVDGMNVLAVREAAQRAVDRARDGKGPTLLECKTYRWYGHSRSDPRRYRTDEEEAAWHARDPINQLRDRMMEAELLTEEEFTQMEDRAHQAIETATDFALNSPAPPVEELHRDVYVDTSPGQEEIEAERRLRERVRRDSNMRRISYREALNEALREEMERDERVFIMGEDVGLYGGAYHVTEGLFEDYGGERVRDTAISEAAIAGAAIGSAMTGMRPVAEIMYIDFATIAMDQIANQGAKNRYMFGGRTKVPMVVRTQGGTGRCMAAQHSQSLEALWAHFPGIYVVMPATPYDAKGLLKASIRDDNPVMFIEHKMLYNERGPVPEEEYLIPLGVADVKRPGEDVTLVGYSRQLLFALQAAEQLAAEGVEAEVIDLRCLKPLDVDTIVESVRKTGRLVVVSEAYKTGGFHNEVIARINEEAFFYLDAPPVRVAAADVPVPMSEVLEDATIPQVPDIVRAVRRVLG
ncbi:MAG: pyruvate dehydrogenase complex E1 component subunit beta, partial [Chloroflexota bacterium]|nr:pyruvate dehydrogenase complex E1 component subunit beta [Chloroflexota bacterium]